MPTMLTLDQVLRALHANDIRARAANGNLWPCRINGAAKTWKTRPGHYSIPVKIGFRSYAYITHETLFAKPGDGPGTNFVLNTMCPSQY